jgi:hypothetical protein
MCHCPYILLCECPSEHQCSVKIADFDYTRQLEYYLKPVDICSIVCHLFDYRGGTLMYRGPEVSACFRGFGVVCVWLKLANISLFN